ncbi:MAG: D-inositol 3-phosphate glycosyltransferase [candidate division BRC1 bacterium ADurb.BinA292]|nr:MAG: D-inositol 3-phosphate glycosyltransferase [candidate division BRC1 bacterium ADurb.BinA292]
MHPKPLRIGIVCYPTYGGSGAVATELGRLLARRGHTIHFLSYARPFRLDGDFQENIFYHEINAENYPLFQGQLYTISAAVKIVEIVRNIGLDLIHLHYALPHAISAWMAQEMLGEQRIPMLTTLHGTDITLVGSKPSFHAAVQLGLDKSDMLTGVSNWLRAKTCELFRICNRIRVVYNFIDPELFQPARKKCPRRHFAADDEQIVMHISNFRPVKRVEEVVRIFARMQREVKARLLLIGDGPDREKALAAAEELGIHDRVALLGKQPGVEHFLPLADLFLFPSTGESFGLAALEAMASGVPVVGCRAGGLPEVVIDGECGYLRACDDLDGMAEAGLRVLRDAELRRAMGEAGRRRAIEEFAADKIIAQYEQVYREMLAGAPACPVG